MPSLIGRLSVAMLLAGGVACFACSKSSAGDDSQTKGGGTQHNWSCFDAGDGTSCSCEDLKPGVESVGSGMVEACVGYGCCLLTNQETMPALATCTCIDSPNCQAEAASRAQTTVVDTCPPGATLTPAACAAQDENCRYDYLAQNELAGCCAGTLCKTGANGIPTCQPGSDEELAEAAQCTRAAKSHKSQDFTLSQGMLVTSVGVLTFNSVKFALLGVGPSGCLNSIDMTFSGAGTCSLHLTAALENGALTATGVNGSFSGCDGYTGSAQSLGAIAAANPAGVDLSVQGAACDGGLIFESYCFGGHFDWHLDNTFGSVTISDQHLIADGTVCSAEPMGACPTE